MAAITGVVFYRGKSLIDGKPIIGIATFMTKNAKTGNLVQTWILREDVHPIEAINNGADESICGSCPLRGVIRPASERTKDSKSSSDTTNKGRSCYVLVQNAPLNIWHSYHKGNYPELSAEHKKHFFGKGLRYGSYGDPVAIPLKAWEKLAKICTGTSEPGYTHQWRDKRFQRWALKVMASTHSIAENKIAQAAGWRTFRTSLDIDDKAGNETICPASEAGGFKANCETCGMCNGRKGMEDGRRSIVILGHGHKGKLSMLRNVVEAS